MPKRIFHLKGTKVQIRVVTVRQQNMIYFLINFRLYRRIFSHLKY